VNKILLYDILNNSLAREIEHYDPQMPSMLKNLKVCPYGYMIWKPQTVAAYSATEVNA
jgi:hypothetical protein